MLRAARTNASVVRASKGALEVAMYPFSCGWRSAIQAGKAHRG